MKYTLLAFGILFFAQNVNAQLTNAEVFDFEIGDVFQVKFDSDVAGYLVQTDTIIDKIYSPTLDTIFYTIDRLVYYHSSSPSYNESTVIQTVTNLNSLATHFTSLSCLPATDSSFMDSCGNYIERLHSNADESCFEPEIWYSDLYRGLGGPYYYTYDPSSGGNYWYSKTLTYYNSSQFGECGTPYSYAGIEELSQSQIKVAPNPLQNQTTIYFDDFIGTDYQLQLYSLCGKMVFSEIIPLGTKEHVLNCGEIQSGMYILDIRGDISSWSNRIIIE